MYVIVFLYTHKPRQQQPHTKQPHPSTPTPTHLKKKQRYEMTVKTEPRCAEAWNNLGILYRARGDIDGAARCYQQSLHLKPNFPQACNNLAVLHTAAGRTRQAYSLLQAAILSDPTYAEAYNNMGVLLPELGMAQEAVEAYDKCIALCAETRNAGVCVWWRGRGGVETVVVKGVCFGCGIWGNVVLVGRALCSLLCIHVYRHVSTTPHPHTPHTHPPTITPPLLHLHPYTQVKTDCLHSTTCTLGNTPS